MLPPFPECANPDTCQKISREFRETRAFFQSVLSPLEAMVTKHCATCHMVAVFEVRARS